MGLKGTKEIKELIDGLDVVYHIGKEVMQDGRVDFSDAITVLKYRDSLPILVAAVDGVKDIGEEIKDLDGQEAIELIQLLVSKIKAV